MNHAATILSTEFFISLGQERPEYTGRESKRGACGRQPLADRGPIGPEASSLAQSHTQSRRLEAVAGRRAIGRGQQPFLKIAAYLALQADLWGERTSPKDVPERSRTPLGRAWPGQCRIVSDCGF